MPQSKADNAAAAKEAIWRAVEAWRESLRAETWRPEDRSVTLEVQELLDKLFDVVRDLRDADSDRRRSMEEALQQLKNLPSAPDAPEAER